MLLNSHDLFETDQGVQVTTSEIKRIETDTNYNHSQNVSIFDIFNYNNCYLTSNVQNQDQIHDMYQKQEEKPIKQPVMAENRFDSKINKDPYPSSTVTKPMNNKFEIPYNLT